MVERTRSKQMIWEWRASINDEKTFFEISQFPWQMKPDTKKLSNSKISQILTIKPNSHKYLQTLPFHTYLKLFSTKIIFAEITLLLVVFSHFKTKQKKWNFNLFWQCLIQIRAFFRVKRRNQSWENWKWVGIGNIVLGSFWIGLFFCFCLLNFEVELKID